MIETRADDWNGDASARLVGSRPKVFTDTVPDADLGRVRAPALRATANGAPLGTPGVDMREQDRPSTSDRRCRRGAPVLVGRCLTVADGLRVSGRRSQEHARVVR
jgi:hypothetical protein